VRRVAELGSLGGILHVATTTLEHLENIMKLTISRHALGALLIAFAAASVEAAIISISKPLNSDDAQSRTLTDSNWTVTAPPFPLLTNIGVGYMINPEIVYDPSGMPGTLEDTTLHDHAYVAPYVPDPTRAVVTFQFDRPTAVSELEIIEHLHGITQVEGFVGNSPDALVSIGAVFGPYGDFTTSSEPTVFREAESYVFRFSTTQSATFFQFIVRKTNLDLGFAAYRAFPREASGTRIPGAIEAALAAAIQRIQGDAVEICWNSKSNKMYQVEYRSILDTSTWSALGQPLQGNGMVTCITDSLQGQSQRFYRVEELP
jgi:hypothetical protein